MTTATSNSNGKGNGKSNGPGARAQTAAAPSSALRRLGRALGDYLDRREEAYWSPRELTLMLPVRALSVAERTALSDALRGFGRAPASSHAVVPGMLAARFVLLEASELGSDAALAQPGGTNLVLQCMHEGDREDLVCDLLERGGRELDHILSHCVDYPGAANAEASARYLLERNLPQGLGLEASEPGSRRAHWFGMMTGMRAQQPRAWGKLGRAPRAAGEGDDSLGYPFSLTSFERPAADEHRWVRRTAELLAVKSRRTTREARRKHKDAVALRAAHAKHHGLMQGRLIVRSDLPTELQRGLFVPGSVHPVLVRASNMTERVQADARFDARGLAIKVLDAGSYGERVDTGFGPTAGEQDFHLASHPTFFLKDVRDYALVRSYFSLRDKRAVLGSLLQFGLRRPLESWILLSSLLRRIDHPLAIEYHSMAAFAHGPELAVKYHLRPLSRPSAASLVDGKPLADDYLRERLRRSLDPNTGSELRLELSLMVPRPGRRPSVEDPRCNWSLFGRARRVPVATLVIPPQDSGSEERMRQAERVVFSPWNTLLDHRPLGNLNRARLAAYRASSEHRRSENRHDELLERLRVGTQPAA